MFRTFVYSSIIVIIIKNHIPITVYVPILLEKVNYFETYIIMPVCPHDHIILCYNVIYLRIDNIVLVI